MKFTLALNSHNHFNVLGQGIWMNLRCSLSFESSTTDHTAMNEINEYDRHMNNMSIYEAFCLFLIKWSSDKIRTSLFQTSRKNEQDQKSPKSNDK